MKDHVSLLEWKPMRKNTLLGFATVRLGRSLKIADVTVHAANGRRWASLPSKPRINGAGEVQKDASTGKVLYTPIIAWTDRDSADAFSEAVIAAVEREHPGDASA